MGDMRKRLIELMQKRFAELIKDGDWTFGEMLTNVADHLLANGVVALPCNVGDTVFIIDNKDMLDIDPSVCSVFDDEIFEIDYGRTQSGGLKWLFLVAESGEDFYDDEVGKTVFLTKEEAEQALKERGADG